MEHDKSVTSAMTIAKVSRSNITRKVMFYCSACSEISREKNMLGRA